MRTRTILLIPILLLLFNSCRKKPLPPEEEGNSPVFYVKADVNGIPLSIEAGVQNYVMDSKHDHSNGVYFYSGEFRQLSCSGNCGYSIKFIINDKDSSLAGAVMDPVKALYIGEHPFNDGYMPPLAYDGVFTSAQSATGYSWTVDGGNVPTGNSSQFKYRFTSNRSYSVHLKTDNVGCTTDFTGVFRPYQPLQGNIGISKDGIEYTFSALPYPQFANGQYKWDFGDGSPEVVSMNPVHTYDPGFEGKAKLTMIRPGTPSDTCVSWCQIRAFTFDLCHANFTNSITPVLNSKGLSGITVLVTDPGGNTYSSSGFDQPTGNRFEIVSLEDYKDNDMGDRTKKLKIKFNCKVKSGSSFIEVKNGEAVIAVSYK